MPTTIEVSVANISSKPVGDVRVEAYVTNPTASGSTPSNTVAGISGNGRFVGFRAGVLAASGTPQPVNCLVEATNLPWTPTALQAGHHCVIANTWLDDGSEGVALGPVDFIQPMTNQHHGWRNINVQALAKDAPTMQFNFVVANPEKARPAELLLTMREARGTAAFGVAERNLLRSGPLQKIRPSLSRFGTRNFIFKGEKVQSAQEVKLGLEPGQQMALALAAEFDPRERVGNFHTFDIMTTDPNGAVQGGFRLLAFFAK